MGDRSGLTKLDRTNGFEGGNDYMRVKKSKLAQQNDQIRDALRSRNSTLRTDLFKGVSINVNGRTQPTADELKRLILLNGGDYHPYYRYQTTKFMIATNLSAARIKQLRPDDRIVKPEWITESIQAKCLLPYQDYQLFVEETRGKKGAVLAVETSNDRPIASTASSLSQTTEQQQLMSVTESYSRNYRKGKPRGSASSQREHATKCRDIREMFSKSVRSLDNGDGVGSKKGTLSGSQISSSASGSNYDSGNSCDGPTSSQSNQPGEQEAQLTTLMTTISNATTMTDFKSLDTRHHPDSSTNTNNDHSVTSSTNKKSAKTITMSDFVVKGKQSGNLFPVPRVPEKNQVANICGITDIDNIIELINEWVGCPEGVTDEDTACATKYFFDLMNERNYHNKLYEIIEALQCRVMQHGEVAWISLFNSLVTAIKSELDQGGEASQNLSHLINLIEVPDDKDCPQSSDIKRTIAEPLPTIQEDDID